MVTSINCLREEQDSKNEELNTLREKYLNPTVIEINDFLTDTEKRHEILKKIIKYKEIVIATETYLAEIFKTAWKKTRPDGAFKAYADLLAIFIDIFKNFDLKEFPPTIYMMLISNFENLSPYVNNTYSGDSVSAYRLWRDNKDTINSANKKEIKSISNWNWNIKHLLRRSNFSE